MLPLQLDFLRHILSECDFIIHTVENKSKEEIINDPVLSRALVRSLEIIGEATKRITVEIKEKYVQVDWQLMAKMRDRLIHHYFGIDYDIVYDTITIDIPELKAELERIINLES